MHKEKLKNVKLEQQPNSSTTADVATSSHTNGNTMLPAVVSSKLRPILFSTEMVKAILEGRKTQTRRIIKLRDGSLPESDSISHSIDFDSKGEMIQGKPDKVMDFSKTFPYWQELKPKYKIGDILWVRETFSEAEFGGFNYRANYPDKCPFKFKPSIFMPFDACRIFLKVTNVRIEQLQDISESDANCEGIKGLTETILSYNYLENRYTCSTAYESFMSLWSKINGKESWEQNPYVWVIEFERCSKP